MTDASQIQNFAKAAEEVVFLASFCSEKGWLPATSGNLSVRVRPGEGGQDTTNPDVEENLHFAITRSGADKTRLRVEDVLLVDDGMNILSPGTFKSSAETIVHVRLYEQFDCGSIVHVHTVWNNLISELNGDEGGFFVEDHELLKALNHWEEGARIWIPIVENFHDIPTLAEAVELAASEDVPGVLVRNHGIYAWGDSTDTAKRHLEAFEFLFEYLIRLRNL